jgi:hypothetical protein
VGIYVFNNHLTGSQWLGIVVTVAVITLLTAQRRQVVRLPEGEPALAT